MNPGNLEQITNKVSYNVNFNSGQSDQDFRGPSTYTNQRIHDAINEVYVEECVLAKQNASRDWFRAQHSMTWTADAATMAIPEVLRGKDIELVRDDTNGAVGPVVQVWNATTEGSGLYRYDMRTWGWYPTPGAAKTLTIFYIAEPNELERDDDEPDLIPIAHRDLLVWSASIRLKLIADEDASARWIKLQESLRFNFHKAISLGQPRLYPGQRVRNPFTDVTRSI